MGLIVDDNGHGFHGELRRGGGSIGAGAAPVGRGPVQVPGGKQLQAGMFIRTTDPNEMSRWQRNLLDGNRDRAEKKRRPF